jgi:hypothetical protein
MHLTLLQETLGQEERRLLLALQLGQQRAHLCFRLSDLSHAVRAAKRRIALNESCLCVRVADPTIRLTLRCLQVTPRCLESSLCSNGLLFTCRGGSCAAGGFATAILHFAAEHRQLRLRRRERRSFGLSLLCGAGSRQ